MPWALLKILNYINPTANCEETAMFFVSSLLSSLPTLQFFYYPNFQTALNQRLHWCLDNKDIYCFLYVENQLSEKDSKLVNLRCFFIPSTLSSCSVIFSFKNHSWALHVLRIRLMQLPTVFLPFQIIGKAARFPVSLSGKKISPFWLIMLGIISCSHWKSL